MRVSHSSLSVSSPVASRTSMPFLLYVNRSHNHFTHRYEHTCIERYLYA